MDESFWELMSHGYYAMWVVLAFSVTAVAVAIELFDAPGFWNRGILDNFCGEFVFHLHLIKHRERD